jgi:hypothetical protein
MRALPALLLALLGLAPACEQSADPLAKPAQPAAPSSASRHRSDVERERLHQALMPWLTRRDALPRPLAESTCPDDRIGAETDDDASRTLVLRVEDARVERKSPLPLKITHHLSSLDLGALETATLGDGPALDPAVPERIRWLESRRFVGTFHVTELEHPHWIHRLGHAHPEWIAGLAVSWLVIHDAKSGEPLCATRILVRNDVSDAPLAARTRSEVTERLTEALGTDTRRAAYAALRKISKLLKIEGTADPS